MTNDSNLNHSLFAQTEPLDQPLAARLRPKKIDEVVGQSHLLAPGKPLYQILNDKRATSMVLWGPPGTGKTTLAELVALNSGSSIERISAVTDGVKDIRAAIQRATERLTNQTRTLVFVDEVHRFNKSQQDAFLPHIESGLIQFIGATTENPAFSLNNALLSRTRLFILQLLNDEELAQLIARGISMLRQEHENLSIGQDAAQLLIQSSSGDGRRLLTQLELAAQLTDDTISAEHIQLSTGSSHQAFDKNGDHFYDHLSAFHKSVRGSSVDGALFYFARMLNAGCDATAIARRLLAIASEDIGNADPKAIQVCLTAWDVYHRVGAAEGERALAQAVIYCALAPKSNAVYAAFKQAKRTADAHANAPVPNHLRNAPTKVAKSQGHGAEYRYAHNEPNAYATGEQYLPDGVHGNFYQPAQRGFEKVLRQKQDYLDSLDAAASKDDT